MAYGGYGSQDNTFSQRPAYPLNPNRQENRHNSMPSAPQFSELSSPAAPGQFDPRIDPRSRQHRPLPPLDIPPPLYAPHNMGPQTGTPVSPGEGTGYSLRPAAAAPMPPPLPGGGPTPPAGPPGAPWNAPPAQAPPPPYAPPRSGYR